MDRKSIIILVVCFAAMLLWKPLVIDKFWPPPKPVPGATNLPPTTATAPRTNVPVDAQPTISDAAPTFNNTPPSAAVTENVQEDLLELQTPDARYTFSSRGGGLKTVELLQYKEQVPRKRGQKASKDVAMLNSPARFPALSVIGVDDFAHGNYELRKTSRGVEARTSLTNGLALVKDFTPGSNYLISVTVRLENRSDQPITLPQQEWITGTATPLNAQDDGTSVGAMWYNGDSAKDISAGWFANATLGCIPGTPRTEYSGGESNVLWTSAHNQFFALAVMSKEPAQRVVIRRLDLPVPTAEDVRDDSRLNKKPYAYETAMVYPSLTLAPGASFERNLTIFAGPKEYRTLAAIAGGANNEIDAIMGFGGFFGFFSKGLLLGMNWLHHSMKLSYGWAIIAITIIIKILFWPLTRASTRSMKRMAALQPQMKEIQQKYKDDPAKMNRKTMEFMKENKVSPLGGCLPMLLQMPVFIGFFYMIRSAIELRGAPFLWVADLSRPDTLFMIPGIDFPFNLMPLLMGVTMLWQAHLTPPSPGMDPMQAKIMKYMPLIFLVMLYNFSAGLTLYWTVQNLLTILQTKLTKEKPAAAPAAAAQPARPPQKKRK